MTAFVRFRLPNGETVGLHPGDLIGRLASAALPLDDERISEAHAMVSLRGGEVMLLGLRGRFAVDGELRARVVLRPGMQVRLARGLELLVDEVALPGEAMALRGDDLPQQILPSAASLTVRPRPALQPRYVADADAHLWTTGESWRLRVGAAPARALEPGEPFTVGGRSFVAVLAPLRSTAPTNAEAALAAPLTVIANYDTAHIAQAGVVLLTLGGIAARLVSELVVFGGPVGWAVLAEEVWGPLDRMDLRRRLDTTLARLRVRLRAAGIRSDLVRSDGQGHIELVLLEGDRAEDRTG
jgi:hypothetical protein